MKKVAYSWVITVAIDYFARKVVPVMFEFLFYIGELRIKLVLFAFFWLVVGFYFLTCYLP